MAITNFIQFTFSNMVGIR